MCGFFGEFVQANNKIISKEEFLEINKFSFKRGPDDIGYFSVDDRIQLGFNRLSIRDLSVCGNQPMTSASGRYAVVFNGEIYNASELKSQLKTKGYLFKGHSDTEVLVAGMDIWGFESLISKLNGMFAIAVADFEDYNLFLTRDSAGIKPLFYGLFDGRIIFASQFDQVYKHPRYKNKKKIKPEAFKNYLGFGYMHAPETVYEGIYQLKPGECIRVNGDLQLKYWNLNKKDLSQKGIIRETSGEALQDFDKIFDHVIKDQLISDAPLATFLSGGIDSPLVTAYAAKHNPDITAYTISVNDPKLNEAEYASLYAKKIGIKHKVITFNEAELISSINDHFDALHEPFGDYSSLPTYFISKIAAKENKVMLSGDGGDELFWGYPRFMRTVDHFNWFNFPKVLQRLGAGLKRKIGDNVSHSIGLFDTIGEWVLEKQLTNNSEKLQKWFNNSNEFNDDVKNVYQANLKFKSKEEVLYYLRWNEFYGHLQRVLIKVDRSSMGNSLEVRVPLLDKRVIDFAWLLKPELGINHRQPKYLLKRALSNVVGPELVNLKKQGFGVPIRKWLRSDLKEEVMDLTQCSQIYGGEHLNVGLLRKYVEQFMKEDKGNEWGVWVIFSWQKWAQRNVLL